MGHLDGGLTGERLEARDVPGQRQAVRGAIEALKAYGSGHGPAAFHHHALVLSRRDSEAAELVNDV